MAEKISNISVAGAGFAALTLVIGAVAFSAPGKADAAGAEVPGRQIFIDWSCGSCHVLKDAGGTGVIGPQLDGAKLTKDAVVDLVANGKGAMPAFAGQLSKKEIDQVSAYISDQSMK